MRTTKFKEKLKSKDVCIGSWITLAHPAIAEIMAKAGFDWLAVDLEHSVITIREAEELIRVIDLCSVVPLVRLSANDPVQIKRIMDAGAHGVIVPMVNSAEEARKVVEAVHYPPDGKRCVGLARAQGYGSSFEQYKEWVNQESIVIVQIEHIKAVENLDAILSVEGVDGFIVGPYDLSGSLGIPGQFDNKLMIEAMSKIKNFMRSTSKIPGLHVVEPDVDQLQQRVREGYLFLAYSVDIRMLDTCCRAAIEKIRR
ncbi:MAG: HpcH/HpaI aldolase family protein [Mobilitalea sp.]